MTRSRLLKIAIWVGLFLVLLVNSLHASYPDEFDNILGGKLILSGVLPYKGFFAHHAPLGYFLSAPLVLLGGISFVHFRLLSAVFLWGLFALEAYLLSRRVRQLNNGYFLGFLVALVVAATYFWGQMFLADTLAGYFLALPTALLLLKIYFGEKLETIDLWILSLFGAATLLTSATYLYAVGVLLAVAVIYSRRLQSLPIFAAPYLIFVLYLVVTGSLADFMFQAVSYNQKYYIYNYPRPAGSTAFNPLRYAVVIFTNFYNSFALASQGIFKVNLEFPMTHVLALADLALGAFLAIRRKWLALVLFFGLLVFVTARGNPSEIKPADYQTGVYFILSLLNISLFLFLVRTDIDKIKDALWRPFVIFLSGMVVVYSFFGAVFLFSQFWATVYNRYMGTFPLIYDRPAVAQTVNALVPPDHYCWVGPFEFEEMFYLKCRLPSKYQWILPQFAGIDFIKRDIIADVTKNPPDVIVYRRDFSAFGQSAEFSNFYIDFLNARYLRAKDLGYRFVGPKQKDFNLDEDINFEKSQAAILIAKLVENGSVVHK